MNAKPPATLDGGSFETELPGTLQSLIQQKQQLPWRELAELNERLARSFWQEGLYDAAGMICENVARLWAENSEGGRASSLLICAGQAWFYHGDFVRAVAVYTQAVSIASASYESVILLAACYNKAITEIQMGNPAGALDSLAQVVEGAKERGDMSMEYKALSAIGLAHMLGGHPELASKPLRSALLLTGNEDLALRRQLKCNLGCALLRSGRFDEGNFELSGLLDDARESNLEGLDMARSLYHAAESLRLIGDVTNSITLSKEAATLAENTINILNENSNGINKCGTDTLMVAIQSCLGLALLQEVTFLTSNSDIDSEKQVLEALTVLENSVKVAAKGDVTPAVYAVALATQALAQSALNKTEAAFESITQAENICPTAPKTAKTTTPAINTPATKSMPSQCAIVCEGLVAGDVNQSSRQVNLAVASIKQAISQGGTLGTIAPAKKPKPAGGKKSMKRRSISAVNKQLPAETLQSLIDNKNTLNSPRNISTVTPTGVSNAVNSNRSNNSGYKNVSLIIEDDKRQTISALCALGMASLGSGKVLDAEGRFTDQLKLALEVNDLALQAKGWQCMALCTEARGEHAESLPLLHQSMRLAISVEDISLQIEVCKRLICAYSAIAAAAKLSAGKLLGRESSPEADDDDIVDAHVDTNVGKSVQKLEEGSDSENESNHSTTNETQKGVKSTSNEDVKEEGNADVNTSVNMMTQELKHIASYKSFKSSETFGNESTYTGDDDHTSKLSLDELEQQEVQKEIESLEYLKSVAYDRAQVFAQRFLGLVAPGNVNLDTSVCE